jgi:hypothetical protein
MLLQKNTPVKGFGLTVIGINKGFERSSCGKSGEIKWVEEYVGKTKDKKRAGHHLGRHCPF